MALAIVGPDYTSGGGGGGTLTGSGTANKVAKWDAATELANSTITDNGTTVTIAADAAVTGDLDLAGDLALTGVATGNITLSGATSGDAVLSAEDAAGTGTFKLPSTTGGTESLGYLGIPPNSQSAAYSTVLQDQGRCILHPASDANNRAFTIDGSLAYPVNTAISFLNMSANAITIPISTDTLTWIGTGATGTRTLAQYGFATAYKFATGAWVISGTNLT